MKPDSSFRVHHSAFVVPMRDWKLTQADPLALRLAADARFGPTDYADDQIWELALAGGDPPAMALRTTYGLRARDMRLFPGFREGETVIPDPHPVAGQSPPTNESPAARAIRFRLSAVLKSLDGGTVMGPTRSGGIQFLQGQTGNLIPVVVMNGGAG